MDDTTETPLSSENLIDDKLSSVLVEVWIGSDKLRDSAANHLEHGLLSDDLVHGSIVKINSKVGPNLFELSVLLG